MSEERVLSPHKSVTQRDIALRCGLSQMAVSLALRRDPSISEPTIERVHIIAAEMGYDPAQHQAARRMALKKHGQDVINNIVALFLPPTFYEVNYYNSIVRGMLDVLTSQQYGLLTMYLPEISAGEKVTLPPVFSSGNIDGLAMIAFPSTLAAVRDYLRQNPGFGARSIVTIMTEMSGCTTVATDNADGAYAAARHLLSLGHRHIGHFYCGWGNAEGEKQRLDGVRRAYQEKGIDPDEYYHIINIGALEWLLPTTIGMAQPSKLLVRYSAEGESVTLEQYLSSHPEITALIGVNDANALHAWYVLKQQGISVPEDMSLIGFDDTDPMPDDHGHNMLTSVRLPLVEVGRKVAQHILHQIANPATPDEVIVLPTELVVRGSTAPPR
jgi:LacI family transcriptional regulator